MKFSNLQIDKAKENISTKINISRDILKLPNKKSKAELREVEPGFKIGTGEFHSVSQYCDCCNSVQPHCHKPEKRKMICIKCKTIKIY